MSGHATLSPSGAKRWMSCPGSIKLSEGFPDGDSQASREGTFAHTIAERCLNAGTDAASLIGETGDGFTCDEEMAEHLQTYLDAVRAVPLSPNPDAHPIYEAQVGLFGIREDIYGTCDALVPSIDNTLHVFDLKYGAGVHVEVHDNAQLKIYGLGALLSFPNELRDTEKVVLHIVQPRHYKGGHSEFEISAYDLRTWGEQVVRPAAEATEAEDATSRIVPGEWCQFCRAKSLCPGLKAETLKHTQKLFTDETLKVPAVTPPVPGALTDDELGDIKNAMPVIEAWLSAVNAEAYKRASGGKTIPGFKIVNKMSNRKWKDEDEALSVIELFLPEGVSPYAPQKLLSPAQAEKKLKGDKKVLEAFTEKSVTSKVLVPDSDKRPALNRGAVFEDETVSES